MSTCIACNALLYPANNAVHTLATLATVITGGADGLEEIVKKLCPKHLRNLHTAVLGDIESIVAAEATAVVADDPDGRKTH